MRPVRSWKSAAAAPTPISDGTWSVPFASSPWHDEHPVWYSARPAATSSGSSAPSFVAVCPAAYDATNTTAPTATHATAPPSVSRRLLIDGSSMSAHRIRKIVVKRQTHTTSTKCQYQVVA